MTKFFSHKIDQEVIGSQALTRGEGAQGARVPGAPPGGAGCGLLPPATLLCRLGLFCPFYFVLVSGVQLKLLTLKAESTPASPSGTGCGLALVWF